MIEKTRKASVPDSGVRALLVALLLGVAPPAAAVERLAEEVAAVFNWYYAAAFGTGTYTVDGERVTVLTVPISYTLREATDDVWGVRLTVPTSAAFGNFDLYNPDFDNLDQVHIAAWSFMPGADVIINVNPYWRLQPFANIGRGREFQTETTATIYQLGISTHYRWPELRNPEVELGAKAIYAGYRVAGAETTPISRVAVGAATAFPIPMTLSDDRQTTITTHLIVSRYLTDLEFLMTDLRVTEIRTEYEAGISLGVRPAYKIFGMTFDRIGLSYVTGSDGLHGVRVVTEFPF